MFFSGKGECLFTRIHKSQIQ